MRSHIKPNCLQIVSGFFLVFIKFAIAPIFIQNQFSFNQSANYLLYWILVQKSRISNLFFIFSLCLFNLLGYLIRVSCIRFNIMNACCFKLDHFLKKILLFIRFAKFCSLQLNLLNLNFFQFQKERILLCSQL